jgi:four helix bundle protein
MDVKNQAKLSKSRNFQDLDVWKKSHAWVLDVYRLSENFPKHELFGLTSQLRRAAVSVPANIAEGFKRKGIPDKARVYNIAQGSLEECRYYLILVRDLRYADTEKLAEDLDEVSRLLDSYLRTMLASTQ